MKFKFLSIAALFALVATMSSCEDLLEDTNTPDGSTPMVNINSPSQNKVYKTTDPVHIAATMVDKDQIKDLSITIQTSSSEDIFKYKFNPNRKSFGVDTVFAAEGLPVGDYNMKVKAVDGRTNSFQKEIKFSVK